MSDATEFFQGTGRRKTATARVRLTKGTGQTTVNGKTIAEYLCTEELVNLATLPLTTVELRDQIDTVVLVAGGGPNGQARAISHGLARALQRMNPELRPALKKVGLLTRDPREKERKKSGQPGARKRFQFSKR